MSVLGRAKRARQSNLQLIQYDLSSFAHGLAAALGSAATVYKAGDEYRIKLPGEELELAISTGWDAGKYRIEAIWPQSKTFRTEHLASVQFASERKLPLSTIVPRIRKEVLEAAHTKLPSRIQEESDAIAAGKAAKALREQFIADFPEIDVRYDKNHGWQFKSRRQLDRKYTEPHVDMEGELHYNGVQVRHMWLKMPVQVFAEIMAVLRKHGLIASRDESETRFYEEKPLVED